MLCQVVLFDFCKMDHPNTTVIPKMNAGVRGRVYLVDKMKRTLP